MIAVIGVIAAIAINAQPGDTFTALGIEWKKSGLTHWMFWISLLIVVIPFLIIGVIALVAILAS